MESRFAPTIHSPVLNRAYWQSQADGKYRGQLMSVTNAPRKVEIRTESYFQLFKNDE